MIDTIITKLTQSEIKSGKWQNDGWAILHIGPTPNWRTEWGEWESIRDLIQNALDETEAFKVEQTGTDLIISDNGTGLAVKDLFLGAQKQKEPHLRGKFGEGLKVAALALLRLGYGLTVETVGRDIMFVLYEQEIDGGDIFTLAALWRKNDIGQGTRVTIHGYDFTKPDYSDRFIQTADLDLLHKTKAQITKPIQRYNCIYKAKQGKAAIFARNIYLRDIEGSFSYDIWDFEMSPDRHAPRYDFEMWNCIARTWQTVTDEKLMIEFFKAIRDKTANYLRRDIEMSTSEWTRTPDGLPFGKVMEANSNKWNRAFVKTFGECTVLRTAPIENLVEAQGHRSVELPNGITEAMRKAIRTDESLIKSSRDATREVEVIDDNILDPRQLITLNAARELTSAISKDVTGVFASHLPSIDGIVVTALYHSPTQQILFSPLKLSSWEEMMQSLVHEGAHALGGMRDCSFEHTQCMEIAATRIATYIALTPNFVQRYLSIIK